VHRIETGRGRPEDLALLDSVAENIMGRTICALGDAAALPVRSFLKHFRAEFEQHVAGRRCTAPGPEVEPRWGRAGAQLSAKGLAKAA
jgi:NADH-quinone oxidoreductase subunit F